MADITIKSKNCTAVINYHGAELKSFTKNGKEYMWCGDAKYWGRTAPVLFPFVGAVSDNKFRYQGAEYPMGQHGFARDMDFLLVESTGNACKFLLKSDRETLARYPMDFELSIGYRLSQDELEIQWEVVNPGKETLEFSIGAHPAFNCVLNESSICLKKCGKPLNQFINSVFGKGLLTNRRTEVSLADGILKLNEHSFDGDAFVIENSQVDCIELLDNDNQRVLSVDFSSPLVGIWSPPGKNAPFLCIEPWYGRADQEGFRGELKDREWNNSLGAGEKFAVSYRISV